MTAPWLSSSPLNLGTRLDPLPHGFKDCLPLFNSGKNIKTGEESSCGLCYSMLGAG
ncbi:hypothetical protein KI387_030740, partial [Taxus chinensis]